MFRKLALVAALTLALPLSSTTTSVAQAPPQMRQSIDTVLTAVSFTEYRRVFLLDTTGYQSYEVQAVATTPSGGGDFGTLAVVFYESNPDTTSATGEIRVLYKFEIDAGAKVEGPIRGGFMEVEFLSPASNLSAVEFSIDMVARAVETDKARDEGGLPLNQVWSNVTAGTTTAYEYPPLVSGNATLVLGAPSRKGTFRVQLGGADFEDILVPAGQTLRVPYTLPLRSMSVRVTNTDLATASYSARLIAAA